MGETLSLALTLEGRIKPARSNEQLVVIAEALATLPDPEIDTSFMLALEQRLLTEDLGTTATARRLEAVPAIPPTPADEVVRRAPVVQMPKRRFVVRRSLVAVAAAASLAAFPVVAAAQALPGSPFHGIKTRIEQLHMAIFDTTPTEKAFAHMTLAQLRLAEVAQLTAMNGDPAHIAAGLVQVEAHLASASELIPQTGDANVLRKLAEEARATEMALRDAASGFAPSAEDAFADALGTSLAIQNDVADALGLEPVVAKPQQTAKVIAATLIQPTGTQAGSQQQQVKSRDDKPAGDPGKGPGNDDDLGPGGGKTIDDVPDGCYIPGSENGLGDWGAPVAKLMCSI